MSHWEQGKPTSDGYYLARELYSRLRFLIRVQDGTLQAPVSKGDGTLDVQWVPDIPNFDEYREASRKEILSFTHKE